MVKSLAVLALVAGLASSADASILADSMADYSGTQGNNGWFYGYYEITHADTYAGFQPMTEFDGSRWFVDSSHLWTSLGPGGGHPNGTITSGPKESDEQWAARRWVSTYTGLIDLDAVVSKLNVNPAGNGVTGRIYVDGVEVWSQYIATTDSVGVSPSLQLNVTVGTAIDLILDPTDGNDWADNTRFSAVITSVPAPAAVGLLGIIGLASARRRRPI